jgi:hypothetical protein
MQERMNLTSQTDQHRRDRGKRKSNKNNDIKYFILFNINTESECPQFASQKTEL